MSAGTWWVIVADEAKAILYSRNKKFSPLEQRNTLQNPDARAKTGDLISDRGGRSFDSRGEGRHTMTSETSPKEHLAQAFAKLLAERIGQAVREGRCEHYAIIAAPRFLGHVRAALPSVTKLEPWLTVDKAVVGRDTATIEKLIADHMP